MLGVSGDKEEGGKRRRCQQRVTLRRGSREVGGKPGDCSALESRWIKYF